MEVLAVQQQYQTQYGLFGSNKVKDWSDTLTPPQTPPKSNTQTSNTTNTVAPLPYLQNNTTNKIKNSINKNKSKRTAAEVAMSGGLSVSSSSNKKSNSTTSASMPISNASTTATSNSSCYPYTPQLNNLFYCDNIDAAAVNELSLRLLDELRAAKSRHLTCTEVSLPCDLTPRIAAEIIRVSEKEPCGIRGCTIYIEFEDEPNNSRRIATLKLDAETVSTFEVYLTLRQDHRGWTALLPQFMKSLARTITISPEFTITKHKLYSPQLSSYSYGSSSTAAISTPSS